MPVLHCHSNFKGNSYKKLKDIDVKGFSGNGFLKLTIRDYKKYSETSKLKIIFIIV